MRTTVWKQSLLENMNVRNCDDKPYSLRLRISEHEPNKRYLVHIAWPIEKVTRACQTIVVRNTFTGTQGSYLSVFGMERTKSLAAMKRTERTSEERHARA